MQTKHTNPVFLSIFIMLKFLRPSESEKTNQNRRSSYVEFSVVFNVELDFLTELCTFLIINLSKVLLCHVPCRCPAWNKFLVISYRPWLSLNTLRLSNQPGINYHDQRLAAK